MTQPRHIVFLLLPSFTHLAFSCALEPLRIANRAAGRALYRWSLASPDGQCAHCSNGSVTLVDQGMTQLARDALVMVVAGIDLQAAATAPVLAWLRRERAAGTSIGAICSGAYVLARAGFLDGRKAAIHWEYHDLFREEFPDVELVPSVFVADERFMTASGGTAAADLMLHMIAAEHGGDLSIAVADQMVYNAVRQGTAAQRVSLQARHGMRNEHLSRAVALLDQRIEEPIALSSLAREVGISRRQLERLFLKYLGTSPRRYMNDLRLNRARNLIVQTEHSITDIAISCGFNSTSHFARLFRSRFGVSPVCHRTRLN